MKAFKAVLGDRSGSRARLGVAVAFLVLVSVVAAPDQATALPATSVPTGGYPAVGSSAASSAGGVSHVAQPSEVGASVNLVPNVTAQPSGPPATAAEQAAFAEVSAGGNHSCALRTDGTITCWGNDWLGQATAPSGSFTQVSSGGWYSCGLRTDGTITCWGDNSRKQTTAPSGSFTQVSTGFAHSCALGTDGTITCWGDKQYGQASPPKGSFIQVSAGVWHSCGLRTDRTITCWGSNQYGRATSIPPSGSFTQISSGGTHSCALRSGGTVACWGDDQYGQATPPSGSFTQVSTGNTHSCGLGTDATIICWGNNFLGQATAPSGSFTQVSTGSRHSCGLRSGGSVVCWGVNQYGQAIVPAGWFIQVSAGGLHSCGLRSGGSVICWGDNSLGQAMAPAGWFIQVSASGRHSCGLRTDATITCWGNNQSGQATPPSGSFTQVATGETHSCGLRTDATITCWGNNQSGQATPPSGSFTQVATGDAHSCGLRTDATISCWGNIRTEWEPTPSGSFTQVTAGFKHSCGLRSDGSAICWGHRRYLRNDVPPGPFTQISTHSFSCGLRSGGSVVCWSGDVVLPTGPGCGDGLGPGESGGLPGPVVGVGVEINESGRNLFWSPTCGVLEYEVDARESGKDRADYRSGITCPDRRGRCDYLLDGDKQTSEAFRAAPELRVRAVNRSGEGPWSAWVSVGEAPPGQVEGIGQVEGLRYGWALNGLVLFWEPLDSAQYYEVNVRDTSYLERHRCTRRVCQFEVDGDRFRHRAFYTATEYRVRAVNEAGPGPWSEFVTIDMSGKPRPVAELRYTIRRLVRESGPSGQEILFSNDGIRWRPVRGADSYDLQFQHQRRPGQFVQQPMLVEDLSGEDGWAGCRYECFFAFLRNPEFQVRVRVRATNDQGAGQWSDWVWSIREPPYPPVITELVPEYGFGDDDVVVHWNHAPEAAGYRVEWRYVDYGEARADQIAAASNAERVGAMLDWLADSGNYRVVKPGSAYVGLDTSHQVESVINTSEEKKYILEFRVVALGDGGFEQPSDWARWNTQQLRDKLAENSACRALEATSRVFEIVGVVLALYSGGLGAGILAVLKSQLSLGPDGITAVEVLAGCFEDHHPVDVLKELSPLVGRILDITGMTAVVKKVTCGNYYVATNFRDKNFDADDIDGLLQTCYTKN